MRTRAIMAGVLIVAAAAAGQAVATEIDRTFHETFDVTEGFTLKVKSGDGDVGIMPADGDVIDITVRFVGEVNQLGAGGQADFEAEFDSGDDFVSVTGRLTREPALFRWTRITEYRYTISAPPYVLLKIDGDDGDVEIGHWGAGIECSVDDGDMTLHGLDGGPAAFAFQDGDVTVNGASGGLSFAGDDGDVHLSDCAGVSVSLALGDGDVYVTRCSGDFSVTVDDGDVMLDLDEGRKVSVNGEDGDIDLSVRGGDVEDISLSTDDGDVMLSLPPGSSYSFFVSTDDGRLRVDVPESGGIEKARHAASGKVREGTGRVRISTNDGDVVLMEQ